MKYAIVLASGKGTRMKDGIDVPKQFRLLENKPVITYTLNNILKTNAFDKTFLVVLPEYIDYVTKIVDSKCLKKYKDKIEIVIGGVERIYSISNAINYIKLNYGVKEDDIVVIHDGVRPFVTEEILLNSIDAAKKYGAVVSAIPVADTLLFSNNGEVVDEIPDRKKYYKGQAPDSFNLQLFIELFDKLTDEQKSLITGTSQICTLNNYPIYMIPGDEINFKITTSSDLKIAEQIVKKGGNNDFDE